MAVFHTDAIRARFDASGLSFNEFVSLFREWKAAGEAGEFDSPMFGKDGYYERPRIGGEMVLRHVHLEPIQDEAVLERWIRAFKFRSRKKSDRVLVYAQNRRGDFLLIAILPEPDAHDIAEMRTAPHRDLMTAFAEVAQAWLDDGSITA